MLSFMDRSLEKVDNKKLIIVNNTEINNGHLEDSKERSSEDVKIDKSEVDSQNPEVANREHDQGSKSVKEDVGSEIVEKSSMD